MNQIDRWGDMGNSIVVQIINDPDGADVSKYPRVNELLCAVLAAEMSRVTWNPILRYLQRLEFREYEVMTVKLAISRSDSLTKTPQFIAWSTSGEILEVLGINDPATAQKTCQTIRTRIGSEEGVS